MENINNIVSEFENENPSKAIAVRNTLIVVMTLVPNLRVNLSENKLEMIVQKDITMEIIPIYEIGAPISLCKMGQDDPSSVSGSPRLIKAK